MQQKHSVTPGVTVLVYTSPGSFKNSNHLHSESSLGYPEDTNFYLESKASFIDISSIAPCKLFLIAWLREYCTLRTVPLLASNPRLGQNRPSWELFSKNKSCSTIKLFLKLGVIKIHHMNIKKNAIETFGHPWGHRACLYVTGLF